ncbi:MAG: M48 family metallopeptidase, partial [Bdellovibrionales bacterium]|nr:M48 family metallopeptidase [Bdellovibrionales bacterium]
NRLAAHAKLPYDSIPVVVIECGHINAFAMPGGTLKICSELLEKVTDERQRAMVLGHELGHLKHRDFLKRLGRGLVFGVGLAMMFGDNSTVRGFIGHTGNLSGLKFSREEEYAADAYGLELVIAEFGDAGTAIEFYDHLSDFSVGGRFAEFVSTHPFSSNRMERLRTLSKELKVTP